MDVEFEITELKKRISALEANDATMADDIAILKRDMRRVVLLQEDTISSIEALNRRVAALELAVEANVRATEKGFANLQGQIDELRADVNQIKTELASLRKDLPGMIAETMREVLAGMRGL